MFRADDEGLLPVGYRLPNGQDVEACDQVQFTAQGMFLGTLASVQADSRGRLPVFDGRRTHWCDPLYLRKA